MSISIVTATFNAEKFIPRLINSLQHQTDKDFDWIIADGQSTDGTLRLIQQADGLKTKISCQSDFGIYDALNRAIKICETDYYIVVGADDILLPDAIANYKNSIQRDPKTTYDIISAGYKIGKKKYFPKTNLGWLYGMRGKSSSHSVSLMIKKELHLKAGFYSKSFPICADQLFIGNALKLGASINRKRFIAGEYNIDGFSSLDKAGMITELYRVQLSCGEHKLLQTILMLIRLVRNYASIK